MNELSIQDRDFSSIASDIRMRLQAREEMQVRMSYLILEGESDEKCFRSFVDQDQCLIVVAHGSKKVIGAVNLLNHWKQEGYAGIVDADYSRLSEGTLVIDNLFFTDTHDLETMIVRSPAFERVLATHEDRRRIEDFQNKRGKPVREVLIEAAAIIGMLRFATGHFAWGRVGAG